jgi:translation initiation factor 3 subunit E
LNFVQNVIEINRPALPVYQTVIEKTRGLAFRTQALGAALVKTGQASAAGAAEAVQAAPAVAVTENGEAR